MEFKLNTFKTILIITIIFFVIYYLRFIINIPIDYDWPKDIIFRDFKTMIYSYGDNCTFLTCYKIPFKVETQQVLNLKVHRKYDNVFSIDSRTYIETGRDMNINVPNF